MFVKCIKGELIRQVFELGGGNSFKFSSEVQPRVEALLGTQHTVQYSHNCGVSDTTIGNAVEFPDMTL